MTTLWYGVYTWAVPQWGKFGIGFQTQELRIRAFESNLRVNPRSPLKYLVISEWLPFSALIHLTIKLRQYIDNGNVLW